MPLLPQITCLVIVTSYAHNCDLKNFAAAALDARMFHEATQADKVLFLLVAQLTRY